MTSGRTEIDQLRKKHGDELPHSSHVVALAWHLFRRLHTLLYIPADSWKYLEAACLLHDIGFRYAPATHAEKSVELIAQEPLETFSAYEKKLVQAIVLLHQNKNKKKLSSYISDPEIIDRSVCLGAFLRVADGLDHSHLQDCKIVSIEVEKTHIKVNIESSWFPFNKVRATKKADLWNTAFSDKKIKIVELSPPSATGYYGVITPFMTANESLRRLLTSQMKIIAINRMKTSNAFNIEALHDLRNGIRRFRAIGKMYKKLLPRKSFSQLNVGLRDINRELGKTRDIDVWVDFLEKNAENNPADTELHTLWERYKKVQSAQWGSVMAFCLSGEFNYWFEKMTVYVRSYLHGPDIKNVFDVDVNVFLAKVLRKGLKTLGGYKKFVEKQGREEQMHAFRKNLRLQRYYAEIAEPVFGDTVSEYLKILKDLSHALGDYHDSDVFAGHLRADQIPEDNPTIGQVLEHKKQSVKQLKKCWQRLYSKKYYRSLTTYLKKQEKGG